MLVLLVYITKLTSAIIRNLFPTNLSRNNAVKDMDELFNCMKTDELYLLICFLWNFPFFIGSWCSLVIVICLNCVLSKPCMHCKFNENALRNEFSNILIPNYFPGSGNITIPHGVSKTQVSECVHCEGYSWEVHG